MTIQEAITNNGELAYWLERWKLIPDGPPLATHTSQLLPVKMAADGMKAMLKITHDESEQLGCALMAWCGLSATWSLEINAPISIQYHVAELALVELDR